MKNIQIKKLSLINFKGIEKMEIDFSGKTNIAGDNATGKTTIFDSITWLLFGKDSQDRKDFDIKNTVKSELNKRDHVVTAYFLVNDKETTLQRVYKEKWVKPRGQAEEVFSGHETEYFVNLVPKSQKEYQECISEIVNEYLFKLITSPTYFTSLHWEKQRSILISLAGDISDSEIAANNKEFVSLLSELSGKTITDYKKQIAAQKKLLKDTISTIPSRIEECERQIPTDKDYKVIENRLIVINEQIEELQVQIGNIQKQSEADNKLILDTQEQINGLKLKRNAIINKLKNDAQAELFEKEKQIAEKNNEINKLKLKKDSVEDAITSIESGIKQFEQQLTVLSAEFDKVSNETYKEDENSLICPTCKQSLPDISFKRESLVSNFNTDKTKRLEAINLRGVAVKSNLNNYKVELGHKSTSLKAIIDSITEITQQKQAIEAKEVSQVDIESVIANNSDIRVIDAAIHAAEELIIKDKPAQLDTTEQLSKIKELTTEADTLKLTLNERNQKETLQKRISELDTQLKSQNQELATLEGKEFLMTSFEKAKMEYVESKVNSMFEFVKFKLFETQINGGEKPICEAMVNGVPYSVLNNAMRINAGIDIINTLCNCHKVYAPIVIDNAESVNLLHESKSQTIRLVVTTDKNLVITYA